MRGFSARPVRPFWPGARRPGRLGRRRRPIEQGNVPKQQRTQKQSCKPGDEQNRPHSLHVDRARLEPDDKREHAPQQAQKDTRANASLAQETHPSARVGPQACYVRNMHPRPAYRKLKREAPSPGHVLPQSFLDAMRAPSAIDRNFAQAIFGWATRPPRPQSVPAITFSRPTRFA